MRGINERRYQFMRSITSRDKYVYPNEKLLAERAIGARGGHYWTLGDVPPTAGYGGLWTTPSREPSLQERRPPIESQERHTHFHFHTPSDVLERVERLLGEVMKELNVMDTAIQAGLDALKADVANLTTVDTSAITLIEGFAAQLATATSAATSAGASPEQVQALIDLHTAISADAASLAAAVTANTPTLPVPPVPVAPTVTVVSDPTTQPAPPTLDTNS